ncbi:unnamed protein product [Spirodela intermedia]|uniref:Uncharacterized protein n=2 Tax=Spirodela intermedia TaxID=51605 RepID=A0ABN7ECD7_SPIIN|nr:unnamed protein product [Spirodela intermedia]CAA6663119.1 unnamed protein product [Spirodela intermedia]CAA6674724.1 unnamed protein product [Spirodela intermedia]CAA7399565.1 unnamed protein product [Spirodela intermedia]
MVPGRSHLRRLRCPMTAVDMGCENDLKATADNLSTSLMAQLRVLPIIVLLALLLPLATTTEASRELTQTKNLGDKKFFFFFPKFCSVLNTNTTGHCLLVKKLCFYDCLNSGYHVGYCGGFAYSDCYCATVCP